MTVTAENYAGRISLTIHLAPSDLTCTDTALIMAERTTTLVRVSETEVAIAGASELRRQALPSHEGGSSSGEEQWCWETSLGDTARLDRVVTIFTSRDVANPAKAAADRLATIRAAGFPAVVQAHVDVWRRKWEAAMRSTWLRGGGVPCRLTLGSGQSVCARRNQDFDKPSDEPRADRTRRHVRTHHSRRSHALILAPPTEIMKRVVNGEIVDVVMSGAQSTTSCNRARSHRVTGWSLPASLARFRAPSKPVLQPA